MPIDCNSELERASTSSANYSTILAEIFTKAIPANRLLSVFFFIAVVVKST